MKNFLTKSQIITNGDMTQTLTSKVTQIQIEDNIGIQLNFTGTPTGSFAINVSLDHVEDYLGNVLVAGNWVPLTLQFPPVASGGPGTIYLDLNQLSAPYIQVVYTPQSGSGTLNAFIGAKSV